MFKKFYLPVIMCLALVNCSENENLDLSINPADYNETWTSASHGEDVAPDYNLVFSQSNVLEFNITINSDDWLAMQNDLAENNSSEPIRPGGPPIGGAIESDFTPIWVPCSIMFNNKVWSHVGIRFKGNSSLRSVYQSNIQKFSFKIDFDEFEDDYPEIKNQRFYGFKQLNLNNNFGDYSEMHEKIAPDLFRAFGVSATQTAFVALYMNIGSQTIYYGIYTLVEEVDNTVIKTQFTNPDGNLYKPEGSGATFALGTFNYNDMYKKTNEETGDYSDVETFYNLLHNGIRNTNTASWQVKMEAVFDVEVFLKWLAVNTTIQNWDTYGRMNHNYYLYNNPENSKLQWIPWDNNEAFNDGKQGGAVQIDLSDVSNDWPIINYIIEIPEYKNIYKSYLSEFTATIFNETTMNETYEKFYNMIRAYVASESTGYSFTSSSKFDSELILLKEHVANRNKVVKSYIN